MATLSKTSTYKYDLKTSIFRTARDLITPGSRVVVGLSGGADSTFLLHLLVALKEELQIDQIIAAHLDHGWRPESRQDMLWCKQKAESLGALFVAGHAADYQASITQGGYRPSGSLEDLGRRLRRAFFEDVARRYGATHIALAHHKDDQEETFFIRLARGASITGLAGIKPREGLYIRPLLGHTKQAIVAWLQENNISFLTDSTNESTDFLRNRIRHGVMPALRASDSRFEASIVHTMEQLQEIDAFLAVQTKTALEKVGREQKIALAPFLELDPYLQKRVLLDWLISSGVKFTPSQGLLNEILRFLQSNKSPTHTLYGAWILIKKRGEVRIQRGVS